MAGQIIVLVTGGSGLVGQGVKWAIDNSPCDDDWVFVTSKDADLTDWNQTLALFQKVKPTHVLHLAAKVGGLFHNMRAQADFFKANIAINSNVMEAAMQTGCVKVVSCLSTCIFPDKTEYPITEDMIHNGPPHESNFGYAYAKRMVDVLGRAYLAQYPEKTKFVSVVPCNVFGPHDNFELAKSHVIPGLIHRAYIVRSGGETVLPVRGSGRPLRQFIYSRDLGRLLVWAVASYEDGDQPIILAPDVEISIGDVAAKVATLMDPGMTLSFDSSYADGQYKKTASNSKLRRLHSNFQFTALDDALAETVSWFVANHDVVRK